MKGGAQTNLKDVLSSLKSTKITDRRDALAAFRTIFEGPDFINKFHINSDGVAEPRNWLVVYQHLFEAVVLEKLSVTKAETSKSATSLATAKRRLEDVANTLRWLTERTVHFMNNRVTKPIYEHLLQTISHRGEILAPVALPYVKALRCLASYTPHLDHLDDDTWIRMVELCFNNILGDPIRSSFEDDSVAPGGIDESDLFLEDDPMSDGGTSPPTTKKRKRTDRTTTVRPPPSKITSRTRSKLQSTSQQVFVSHEQVEFMGLLSVLLQSTSSPILSREFPYLPLSILTRLERFLHIYTGDTSLLHDYILALSSTLSHLSLNKSREVAKFARGSWDALLGIWGTKNKRIKEGLVSVLHILIPFITSDSEAYEQVGIPFNHADGLSRLSAALNGEADSRWGVDGLSLDCLRFEMAKSATPDDTNTAFVAQTFRYGPNFDSNQALAWSILELQAECIAKLFKLSENTYPPTTSGLTQGEAKRPRLENPIASLLISIQQRSQSNVRAYNLQTLLFVIDRHWHIFHETLQQEIIQNLLQFVSFDDGIIQSWVFLCFAAIASAVASPSTAAGESAHPLHSPPDGAGVWDLIWTNAVRRTNVPIVSRAACHAAYAIIIGTRTQNNNITSIPLASARVLFEIETLAKDIDVQGPPHPFDSVCAFLTSCLRLSSQDMHLYKMRLEEKVLSWFIDCWQMEGLRSKVLSAHMVKDIISLLESICGFTKRSNLISRVPLPEGQIVQTLIGEAKTKVIKDFMLRAHLPSFQYAETTQMNSPSLSVKLDVVRNDSQLLTPRGRERRISAFFLKTLERLVSEWEVNAGQLTAETARQTLDMAVTALSFETALVMNGTQSDRRLIQCACTLMRTVVKILLDARWTSAEKALICLGLDPLITLDHKRESEKTWNAMLSPDAGSGIRTQLLNKLLRRGLDVENETNFCRITFLKIMWQNTDAQVAFSGISDTLRELLRLSLTEELTSRIIRDEMELDEQDGFGPIRTSTEQHPNKNETSTEFHSMHLILDSCISFLTVGPALQSTSGEPTRDRDLIDAVINCATTRPEIFLLVFPIVLAKSRQGVLNLSVKNIDSFLNELPPLLQSYHHSRSHRLQSLVTQLLESTMDVWASPNVAIGEALDKVRALCTWLSGALRKKKIKYWLVRDSVASFFDHYILKDPTEHVWALAQELDNIPLEDWPSSLLPMMGADDDVRVRFRVAVLNPHLFAFARSNKRPIDKMYMTIKEQLTVELNNYEHMLTRILSLGNVMVVGSAVRRGAYWHLLETCFHTPLYTAHIEVVLRGVSQRMGLSGLSSLFEAYAAQLAYSIRKSDSDFLLLPPQLLGYQDRKSCAIVNFRAFTPTNIWNEGRNFFENHCKIIAKSSSDGLRSCFGDVLGYQIVAWLEEHDTETSALGPLLRSMTFQADEYDYLLAQNVDSVVSAILRSLGDQDFSSNGPIVAALKLVDQTGLSATAFGHLTRFRNSGNFSTHLPNLPAFPADTILRALQWLRSEVTDVDHKATTYHILHQLFADVDRSFLVNEQFRLLNAICLWIAIHISDFQEITLLHTLIHRTTSLLGQLDLARSAQSILDWSFECYRKAKTKHPRIPNILVQICCTAYDYSRTTIDDDVMSLGIELLRWIDLQTYKLSQVSSLSSQVMQALPAWPHQPSSQLIQLCQSITGEHLSAVLEDHRLASSKFRLVRRLRDYATSKNYDESQFARVDFWRLKQCIPSSGQLQDTDIDAFADLLYLNKGRLDSFHSESHNSTSIFNRHSKTTRSQVGSAPQSIIILLLALVQGDSTSRSDSAYQTLRLIKAVETEETHNIHSMPFEYHVELDYLEMYKCLPRERTPRNIEDLVNTETYYSLIGNYSKWLAEITTLFSEVLSTSDAFYAQMIPILQADTEFAEQALPILTHALLRKQKHSVAADTCNRDTISKFFTSVLSSSRAKTPSLRSIIDVVLYLRNFQFDQSRNRGDPGYDALSYNKWLDVDFTLLARCSITCGAYTTALLFLQLALESREDTISMSEEIMYEIYRHIDEPDGFYGIQDADLHRNLLKRFHHENQWERAFRFHGAAFEAGDSANHAEGLVKSFHSFGFDHLANDALRAVPSLKGGSNHTSHSTSYRLAWRTETWDLPECDDHSAGASLYLALRATHRERDIGVINATVRKCLVKEIDRLRSLGLENFAEIREVVKDIMCLREIKTWLQDSTSRTAGQPSIGIETRFVDVDPDFDFSNMESIMATRISLVRSARQQEERQQIGTLVTPSAHRLINLESLCLVRLSKAARAANEVQIALNSIVRARQLEKIPSFSIFQEFANVLWCQKEEKIAVEYLDGLRQAQWIGHVQNSITNEEKALVLARLGSWTSAACLKKPDDIQKDYFLAAVGLSTATDASGAVRYDDTHATVYHEYATFAEHQYYEIVKSPDAIRWKIYVDRKRQEIDTRGKELSSLIPDTQVYKRLKSHQDTAQKLLEEDMESSRRHNTARDTYLRQAIDMYSSCLQNSDAYDRDATIRLCSLWFANFEDDEGGLQENIGVALRRVPSHKFVFLSHQLSARISKPQTSPLTKNQGNLQSLVLRMCKEHPFHSLYQVYCLQPVNSSMRRSIGQASSPTVQSERSAAASEIFERLRTDTTTKDRLRDVQLLCGACLQWAQHPIRGSNIKSGRVMHLPKNVRISSISNIRIPVMTHHTPLDATMQYNDCPWINHYDPEWTVAGGKNLPKINTCIGTDGIRYKQLFKGEGEDDLRQDAVMEQVFDLVNDILGRDRETRRRILNVRDYRVIPLASQAGLLEFVENTLPLSGWLPGAHSRYNSGELSNAHIGNKLKSLHTEAAATMKRSAVEIKKEDVIAKGFIQLWKQVQPVMRHFFTEKHKTPISWFAMRLMYTRSVATTSIVGHVLGLGDRHTSNILIDNVSGQVIHIDLGIAFDQGKLLPLPELVPFRMTRDMVDGMGISGTSGVFHRCAEETLRVLRDGSEVIMTVLEVFKHDPLHSWSASETKINRVQEGASVATTSTSRFGVDIGIDMTSGSAEESADRALSSVSRKLDKSLSVQSAVNQLVREATDIRNFMNMYFGWSPLY